MDSTTSIWFFWEYPFSLINCVGPQSSFFSSSGSSSISARQPAKYSFPENLLPFLIPPQLSNTKPARVVYPVSVSRSGVLHIQIFQGYPSYFPVSILRADRQHLGSSVSSPLLNQALFCVPPVIMPGLVDSSFPSFL